MKGHTLALLLLACTVSVCCQTSRSNARQAEVVSVPDLGFRYTPPAGMTDKTSSASKQFREHAASYSAKAAQLILDMSSDEADTAPEWHQVWIFIFPRAQLSAVDDAEAEAKMNKALAGPRSTSAGPAQNVVFAGRTFFASEFEQKEPPLTKHAKIFTTVCKTQLVSFVLVSNSAEQVKQMADGLSSLDFSGK